MGREEHLYPEDYRPLPIEELVEQAPRYQRVWREMLIQHLEDGSRIPITDREKLNREAAWSYFRRGGVKFQQACEYADWHPDVFSDRAIEWLLKGVPLYEYLEKHLEKKKQYDGLPFFCPGYKETIKTDPHPCKKEVMIVQKKPLPKQEITPVQEWKYGEQLSFNFD